MKSIYKLLLIGLLFSICAKRVSADPAFIQAAGAANTSTTLLGQAYASNNSVGNLLVACLKWTDTTGTGQMSDTNTNVYSVAYSTCLAGNYCFEVFYATSVVSGPNTITGSQTGSNCLMNMAIHEYSGADSLDVAGANNGSGAPAQVFTANITTSHATELIFACGTTGSAINGHSPATVRQLTLGPAQSVSEDENKTSVGTYQESFANSGGSWLNIIAGFYSTAIVSNTGNLLEAF